MVDKATLPDNALLDGPDARPLYVGRSSASDSPPTPPPSAPSAPSTSTPENRGSLEEGFPRKHR